MQKTFPLFNTPIDLAHHFWESLLDEGDGVIDATCGNGKDSLTLSRYLQEKKDTSLLCFDIQEKAIETTKNLILEENPNFFPFVQFQLGSHEHLFLPKSQKLKLVVYNLGYLPGGDKSLTTQVSSTLSSVQKALELLTSGGVISLTCYPGHKEGAKEEKELIEFSASLDPKKWSSTTFSWNNRNASPSLIFIQKAL
ncbi:MAG: class I SAM-dependent methyltransferase [Chlamydiota bacterium]